MEQFLEKIDNKSTHLQEEDETLDGANNEFVVDSILLK